MIGSDIEAIKSYLQLQPLFSNSSILRSRATILLNNESTLSKYVVTLSCLLSIMLLIELCSDILFI